jgi:ubiquinone biosynthesis protein
VRFRTALEELGGSFVKLGQMLALQPDILSLEYCRALYDLLDQVKPFEYAEVEQIFIEEFGRRPDQLFDRIDRQPLAAASVGQVHVAWLSGRKVAVKVQRPAVAEEFGGDMRIMRATIRWVERLRLRFLAWVVDPMREFIAWTREELDYRNEARYMELLRRNAAGQAHERIPAVTWELTSRRTLVVDFLEGITALGYLRTLERGDQLAMARLKRANLDPARFADHVIENFLLDAFRHGLFHADLHPANLMILPGGDVGYVDFGITGVLSRYSRRHLIALTLGLLRGDLDVMCAAFYRVATAGPDADTRKFRDGLEALAQDWYESRAGRRRLRRKITLVMLDMLLLSRKASIWPERDVIKFIRSAIAIDGLLSRLVPSFDVNERLEGLCAAYLQTEFWREVLRYETAVVWWSAGNELLATGARRVSALVRNLASLPHADRTVGSRAIAAAGVGTIGAGLLAMSAVTNPSPSIGDPLIVASVLVALAAVAARVMPRLIHGRAPR